MDRSRTEAKGRAPSGEQPCSAREGQPSAGTRALTALASGALALPGLGGPARADSPVEETSLRYAFSLYKEDNLSPGKFQDTGTGSRERYEIYAHQFNLLTPLTSRIDASVDVVFETMSGASPWWVEVNPDATIIGPDGTPLSDQTFLQVMSGATIFDERFDGQITLNHYFDRGKIFLSGGASSEKDYVSGNFGAGFERNYNDKNTTHSVAIGGSWDTIIPTDGATLHNRPLPEYYKKSLTLDTNLTQIITRTTIVAFGLSYKRSTGFLSDPYKRYQVGDGTQVPDSRPEERDQINGNVRLRQFFDAWKGAALHADIGFHWDSWEVSGLSLEASWFQTICDGISIVPSFRYYSQSQAFFYGPLFQFSTPELGTSDYRLSPYGAISYGLRMEGDLIDWPFRGANWLFTIGYDRYISRGSFALSSVRNENPGLVKYHLLSLQVGGRF